MAQASNANFRIFGRFFLIVIEYVEIDFSSPKEVPVVNFLQSFECHTHQGLATVENWAVRHSTVENFDESKFCQ